MGANEQTNERVAQYSPRLFLNHSANHAFVRRRYSQYFCPVASAYQICARLCLQIHPSVSAIWHSNLRWSASHNRLSVSVNQICIDLLSPCHWVGYRLNLSIGLPLYDISVGCHCRDSPADLNPTWNPTPIICLLFFFSADWGKCFLEQLHKRQE